MLATQKVRYDGRVRTSARHVVRVLAVGVFALTGCGGDSPGGRPDAAGDVDAGAPDAGSDAGPPAPPDVCDELGLPRAMMRSGTGDSLGEIAGDFTVHTTTGETWTLSEHWSGCESYVFFVHFPPSADALFRTNQDLLFNEGPRNVRYFFLSDAADPAARQAVMDGLVADLEAGFDFHSFGDATRAFWRGRFHYVTDRATEADGSAGDYLRAYLAWARTPEATVDLGDRGLAGAPAPVVFAIDRAQEFDGGASLNPSVSEAARLGMGAFLGHFYNYRGELEARLAAETATVASLVDETTTARTFVREVTLLDASAMRSFDTLEVDIAITCESQNPFGCSEWDRIGDVQLCVDGMPCTNKLELARWITPYWRPGRQHMLIDATPLLPLLAAGGAQTFFVELGPDGERPTEWVVQVSLRLRTRGGEPHPAGALLAFRGGAFDASYNTRAPFTFAIPAEATRVELVTVLSGHGQTAGDNCAEWCDHRHAFDLNGTPLEVIRHEMPSIGSPRGCAAHAADGVIPGQWGNWAQQRAYWCPGLPVEARRADVTAQANIGADNTLSYQGFFGVSDPRGGDIVLSAYVVWYTAP